MAMSRIAACAIGLVLSQSARFKQRQGGKARTIAGVAVHNYVANNQEWIVVFKKGTGDGQIDQMCNGKCSFKGHPKRGGFGFAKVHASEAEMEAILGGQPDVDFVESDPMDYMIPEIESVQTRALRSWGLDRIGVEGRTATGKGVHIYVQDTGIRTSHEDFGGRAAGAFDMTVNNGTVCNGEGCAGDVQGHGSHCAGSAGGTTFGVAPDAKLYAVKTLSDQGSGERAWQYAGIDWVASEGKRPAVLSMSLGGNGKDAAYDLAFEAAIEAGVTAVVAAGNSNSDTCNFSPAFTVNAITVGASDSDNKRASYSNFGACNDIMAPGSAIVSVSNVDDTGAVAHSGTSMACPHVSGAAALLLEKDAGLTKSEILAQLKSNSINNFIEGIKAEDPNYFLWVSAVPAVSPAPTPAPPPTAACPGWCSPSYCSFISQCCC